MSWHTDATDAVIRAGYEHGKPVAEIADELGCTRCAVIGRANRLGLEFAVGEIEYGLRSGGRSSVVGLSHINRSGPEHLAALERGRQSRLLKQFWGVE